ncbi:fibrillin-3-like [Pomacea canaliculata]|uniref:fibrillin-3-like n=1 Tax=Pomacea canaliculata TaxID=400727 RepID=UPI000D73FA7B|nr:fibrillin-3-like [Pomacea canaliculata]
MQPTLLVTVFFCTLVAVEAGTKALAEECTADTDCADTNAACSTGTTRVCECKATFTKIDTVCAAEHTIGTACLSSDGSKGDCLDVNAICPASKKCECKSGYKGTPGGTCADKNQGSAPAQMSIWMLCMTVIGMSLAVYVV